MASWITNEPFYDIRYTYLEDGDYLFNWFGQEGVSEGFPPATEEEGIFFIRNWIGFSRHYCSLTAVVHGIPRGIGTLFLMPYRKVSHLCMGYLIVDPLFQKRGIGSSLVRNLLHLAKNYFYLESIHFEVFGDSPLCSILEKMEAQRLFSQEKYVKTGQGIYLARHLFEIKLV